MSQILDSHLGTPIGKHGKTIFRRNRKKIFTYEASEKPLKIKSEIAQNNRLGFGKLGKFCNFINKSNLLKLVWKISKQPGSATNRQILKYNHTTYKYYEISSDIHILPESMSINSPEVLLDENKLVFRFSTLDAYWKTFNEQFSDFIPPYVFVAMIHAKDPVNPENKNKTVNVMLEETSETGPFSRVDTTSFSFEVAEKSFPFIKDYNTVLVFPAIISIDEYNCPVKWAETGGIYIKGKHPEIIPLEPEKPREKPGNSFRIEYI
jgi:hypothetical protein